MAIHVAKVESQAIDRFLRVTGSLAADEQADVAAETGGRVIGTPVERGTRVTAGAVLIRISATEADASLREAEANAAQLEARLGLAPAQAFDPVRVPDVQNAKASLDWAEADFNRIKALVDQKVVSQAEYEQRLTQVKAARQQYQTALNGAQQSYRSLQAARARVDLARKSSADTVVRAPFSGIVAERLVSTGDYVTRGMKIATVVRIDPVRVELTVPEQYLSLVKAGQAVRLTVDAYPGEVFTAKVRFVSPALKTEPARAHGGSGRGEHRRPAEARALRHRAPAAARAGAGDARAGLGRRDGRRHQPRLRRRQNNKVEERIVTLGEKVGDRIELATGIKAGEQVAANPRGKLADGVRVQREG